MVEFKHQPSFHPLPATALTLSTHHSTILRCFMRACVPSSKISSPPARLPASPAQPNSPHVPAQIPHSQGRSPRPCRPKSRLPLAPEEPHHTMPGLDSSLAASNHSGALRFHLGPFLGAMRRHRHRQGPDILSPAFMAHGPSPCAQRLGPSPAGMHNLLSPTRPASTVWAPVAGSSSIVPSTQSLDKILNIAKRPGFVKSFPCTPQVSSRPVGLGVS